MKLPFVGDQKQLNGFNLLRFFDKVCIILSYFFFELFEEVIQSGLKSSLYGLLNAGVITEFTSNSGSVIQDAPAILLV